MKTKLTDISNPITQYFQLFSHHNILSLRVARCQSSFSSIRETFQSLPRWAWVAIATASCSVSLYVYYDWTYGVWRRQNVPGPKPVLFVGTTNLLVNCKNMHQLNTDLAKEFGHKGYFGLVSRTLL